MDNTNSRKCSMGYFAASLLIYVALLTQVLVDALIKQRYERKKWTMVRKKWLHADN